MASDNNVTETDISLDSGFPPSGRQYRPVFAQDRDLAVLEMSSIDPNRGASSSDSFTDSNDNRKIKPGVDPSTNTEGQDRSLHNHEDVNGLQRESKLELFGFDSLVNILGLKSMTGDSIPAPSSPRDGEDAIHPDRLKNNGDKLGTMMGVFVHCVQNMLGIIYYIRFSCCVLGAVETFLKALPQARFFRESHLSPEFCTVFGMGGCIHFVSGMDSSGHTAEMLNLLAILQVDNFKPRYYIAAVTDNMSLQKAREMERSFLDKVFGIKRSSIFYIECIARVRRLSLSGLLSTDFGWPINCLCNGHN